MKTAIIIVSCLILFMILLVLQAQEMDEQGNIVGEKLWKQILIKWKVLKHSNK